MVPKAAIRSGFRGEELLVSMRYSVGDHLHRGLRADQRTVEGRDRRVAQAVLQEAVGGGAGDAALQGALGAEHVDEP